MSAEVIREMYAAFNRGDYTTAFELIDPGIELEYRGVVPDAAGSYRGYEGIGRFMRTILESFDVERFEVTPEEIAEGPGGRVAVVLHQRGVGGSSGVPVEIRVFQAWTVRDGRAVRWEVYADREAAFAAAGVG